MGYKLKPNKAVLKRFRVTKTGKLKRGHCLTSHLMSGRSAKRNASSDVRPWSLRGSPGICVASPAWGTCIRRRPNTSVLSRPRRKKPRPPPLN